MAELEPHSSDDQALKAAIAHAWGSEQPPQALRARVEQIAADARAAAPIKMAQRDALLLRPRWPWFAIAAAAIVLLALGIPSYLLLEHRNLTQAASVLPVELSHALVARHDACATLSDHHMSGLPRDNFIAIGKAMSGRLGYPVLSAPLPGIQWVFYGASICSVEQMRVPHLVFRDGLRDVSVFTLPPSAVAGEAPLFETMCDHHPIAGFSRGGVTVCVVGSSQDGSLTLSQTRSLRDALMQDIALDASAAGSRTTVADK